MMTMTLTTTLRATIRFIRHDNKDLLSWCSLIAHALIGKFNPEFVHVLMIFDNSVIEYSPYGVTWTPIDVVDFSEDDYEDIVIDVEPWFHSVVTTLGTFNNVPSLLSLIANLRNERNAPNCATFIGAMLHVYPCRTPDILYHELRNLEMFSFFTPYQE